MTTWVALLRGINLGSHNKVAMAELRELADELGLADPETYLRSGNLVIDSELSESALVHTLTDGIEERFGLQVPVICRSSEQLGRIASGHPFSSLGLDDRFLHVAFLDREPEDTVDKMIDEADYHPDRLEADRREIYLAYPDGSGRSKLNQGLLESRLGVSVTARNWRTVTKLADMVGER
ncbi:MAG: DUF1697 domain-containing protein [Actinomycetota bacterium]